MNPPSMPGHVRSFFSRFLFCSSYPTCDQRSGEIKATVVLLLLLLLFALFYQLRCCVLLSASSFLPPSSSPHLYPALFILSLAPKMELRNFSLAPFRFSKTLRLLAFFFQPCCCCSLGSKFVYCCHSDGSSSSIINSRNSIEDSFSILRSGC